MKNIELTDSDKDRMKRLNHESHYCLSIGQLKSLLVEHKNGNDYDKALIEYRLTDINYHNEVSMLHNGRYVELSLELDDRLN